MMKGMLKPRHVPIIELDTATGQVTRRLQVGSDGRLHFAAVQPIRIRSIAEAKAKRLTASDGIPRFVVAEGFCPPNIPNCAINFHIITGEAPANPDYRAGGLVGTVVYETGGTEQ